MGLSELVTPFYEPLPHDTYKREPVLGQLAWVPVPNVLPIPQILDVGRNDPRSHATAKATIRNATASDFKARAGLPVYSLQLRDNEELLVQRAKRRLVVVVAPFGTRFADVVPLLKQQGKSQVQEANILVAPLYGVQTPEHPNGVPEVMRHRIDALLYSQFFFCPAHASPQVLDSVARLDRLMPVVPQNPAAYDPLPLKLAQDALSVLLALLRLRFGSSQEAEIDTLRDLLADTVPAQFRPASAPPSPAK